MVSLAVERCSAALEKVPLCGSLVAPQHKVFPSAPAARLAFSAPADAYAPAPVPVQPLEVDADAGVAHLCRAGLGGCPAPIGYPRGPYLGTIVVARQEVEFYPAAMQACRAAMIVDPRFHKLHFG